MKMKKIFIWTILIGFMLIFGCVPVRAEECYDSVNIPPKEKQLVQDSPSDTVTKLYTGMFMGAFSEKQDIQAMTSEAVKKKDAVEEYLVQSDDGGTELRQIIEDEWVFTIGPSVGEAGWGTFVTYARSPDKVFDFPVTVSNVYCLNGVRNHNGAYIYYVTDKGDYVLYKEWLDDDKEYLLPVEKFYDFAKIIYEERRKSNGDGGQMSVEDVFQRIQNESSPHQKNRKLLWIGAITGLLVTGCGAGLLYKSKKRKTDHAE